MEFVESAGEDEPTFSSNQGDGLDRFVSLLIELRIDPAQLFTELIELNDQIVDQIRHLGDRQALLDMMAFNLGSKVSFDSKYGCQAGTIVKFNRKSVVVVADAGQQWRDPPHILSDVKDIENAQPEGGDSKKLLR